MKFLRHVFILCLGLIALTKPATVEAQTQHPSSKNAILPSLVFETNNESLQRSLYPDLYQVQPVHEDVRWVVSNDSLLMFFWNTSGKTVLSVIAQCAGFGWNEYGIECRLLRYYPSIGQENPLVMPIGGMRSGSIILSVPEQRALSLNLIYLLSKRLLATAEDRGDLDISNLVARHPLLDEGLYRRDLLAQLLTASVGERVLGKAVIDTIMRSPQWRSQFPSWVLFEQLLWNKWILSAEKPLTTWLLNEPYDGAIVSATRQESDEIDLALAQAGPPASVPKAGRFGLAVKVESGNKFIVEDIDPVRIAAVCGVKKGDQIVSIGGQRPTNLKEAMELLLTGYEKGGAKLSLLREGKSVVLIVRSVATTNSQKTGK